MEISSPDINIFGRQLKAISTNRDEKLADRAADIITPEDYNVYQSKILNPALREVFQKISVKLTQYSTSVSFTKLELEGKELRLPLAAISDDQKIEYTQALCTALTKVGRGDNDADDVLFSQAETLRNKLLRKYMAYEGKL